MRVVHINDKLEVSGGVERYLETILPLQHAAGLEAEWLAVQLVGDVVKVSSKSGGDLWQGDLHQVRDSPLAEADVFHVHSLSEPQVLDQLFNLAPVVRKVADPRMVCPGHGKFWAKQEEVCTIPYGAHCLWHAYSKKCCSRHPVRLLHQVRNTRYEVQVASKRYAAILANSHYTEQLLQEVGIEGSKVQVCHNFTPKTEEPDWEKPRPPVIVFTGRLSRTKGVHMLLKAFAKVRTAMPEAELRILGAGIDEDDFVSLASQLKLEDSVTFLGWGSSDRIAEELSEARVLAFSSIYPEAFGISGIEAMMRGVPVVGFDVGGVGDWLHHEQNGLRVKPKDIDAYADALLRLLREDETWLQYAKAARQTAVNQFSESIHLEKLMSLYEKVLQGEHS